MPLAAAEQRAPRPSLSRTLRMAGRALLLRCPNCGGRRLFQHWWRMRDECPDCLVWLEREEGYWLGAMALNLVGSELLFAALLVTLLVATWPNPPWTFLQYGGVLFMIAFPAFFHPFSRTIWLVLDWSFRPATQHRPGHDHPWPGRREAPTQ